MGPKNMYPFKYTQQYIWFWLLRYVPPYERESAAVRPVWCGVRVGGILSLYILVFVYSGVAWVHSLPQQPGLFDQQSWDRCCCSRHFFRRCLPLYYNRVIFDTVCLHTMIKWNPEGVKKTVYILQLFELELGRKLEFLAWQFVSRSACCTFIPTASTGKVADWPAEWTRSWFSRLFFSDTNSL